MEDIYLKYYISDEQKTSMLKNATIIFDTSALLALYFYSEASKTEIYTKIFPFLSGRTWIPMQVWFEFLKNREKVVKKPSQSYDLLLARAKNNKDSGYVENIKNAADALGKEQLSAITGQLNTLKEKTSKQDQHPYLDADVYTQIDNALDTIKGEIEKFQQDVGEFVQMITSAVDTKKQELEAGGDTVLQTIQSCFNLGNEFTYEEMMGIATEGAFRYKEQIPPGYEDAKGKIGLQKYGDLFIWKEILAYAKACNSDVLLVTNDNKADWVEKETGNPRFELLKEFCSETGHNFWLFNMGDFLYHINQVLDNENQIPEKVIVEIESAQLDSMNKKNESVGFDNSIYQEILTDWLAPEVGVNLIREMPMDEKWKLWVKGKLYEGVDFSENKYLIILNILEGNAGYARTLHSLQSAYEVKKYYDTYGEDYRYIQFILANTQAAAEKAEGHLDKPNPKKIFSRKDVDTNLGYINYEDGYPKFEFVASNHPMG